MPALPAIAIAVTVASTAAAIASSAAQANAQKKSAQYNSTASGYNADILQQQANQSADQIRRQGELTQGQARAAAAASGLGDTGSVQDVTYASLVNNEQDALSTQYRGTIDSYNAKNQQNLYNMSASNVNTQGLLGTTSAALRGGAGVYKAINYGDTTTSNPPQLLF